MLDHPVSAIGSWLGRRCTTHLRTVRRIIVLGSPKLRIQLSGSARLLIVEAKILIVGGFKPRS